MKTFLALTLMACVVGVLAEPVYQVGNNRGGGGIRPLKALKVAKLALIKGLVVGSALNNRRRNSYNSGHNGGFNNGFGNNKNHNKHGHSSGGFGSSGGYNSHRPSYNSGHSNGGYSSGGFGGNNGFGGGNGGFGGSGGFGSSGHSFSSGGFGGSSHGYQKRSVDTDPTEEMSQLLLEASLADVDDCTKEFVCLLHAKPIASLDAMELSIYSLFDDSVGIDVERTDVEFQLAAFIGKGVGVSQCQTVYARCSSSYEETKAPMEIEFKKLTGSQLL
ncbi:peroxisomal membrane protein PEX13-like [Tigriopus californicus]|uniref:peroxisomal membrane protein PEX13-like n=1 Tax=Tigriopus californicus TaxID=6832 RepID=UPI0027D9F329|nr:peroxisomal membrane protein PEX13-like [Tigriopus californicus]